MDSLTVNVTAEDIEKGERGNPCFCPIAQAVRRELDLWIPPQVSEFCMIVRSVAFRLPDTARKFVDDFDRGRDVEPFKFTSERL
jgi:hypothetical protein